MPDDLDTGSIDEAPDAVGVQVGTDLDDTVADEPEVDAPVEDHA
jgi:hypothetical protein